MLRPARMAIQGRIGELGRLGPEGVFARFGVSRDAYGQRLDNLDVLLASLEQMENSIAEFDRANNELHVAEADAGRILDVGTPPYNLTFLDAQTDRLEDLHKKQDAVQSKILFSEQTIAQLGDVLLDTERDIRLLKERKAAPSPWEWEGTYLGLEITRMQRAYEMRRREVLRTEAKALALREKNLQSAIAGIRGRLFFDSKDQEERLARLQEQVKDVREATTGLLKQFPELEKSLAAARAAAAAASDDEALRLARARVAEREAALELNQESLEQQGLSQKALNGAMQIWRYRYVLLKGQMPPVDEMRVVTQMIREAKRDLEDVLRTRQNAQFVLQSRLVAVQKELDADDAPRGLREILRETRKHLNALATRNMDFIFLLLDVEKLANNLAGEVTTRMGNAPVAEKVKAAWEEKFFTVWRKELWVVDERSVTVGKIVSAFLLVTGGLIFSVLLSRYVGHRLTHHFDVRVEAALTIRRLVFYVLVLCVILWALATAGIPLTAFAFLGGAIAIGVGLGAQTLFSQLISGFILLIQKPIRVGDQIQVGETVAVVREIGSRYTRVRSFDNVDILVPNEHFLSNKVTNWTLSDSTARTCINLGVVYGAPVRNVLEILLDVARSHPEVLRDPEPFSLLADFGESALSFELYFWVDVKKSNGAKIRSDIRIGILDRFAAAGIEMAFPQREVRLDSPRPIEVRMVQEERDAR